MPAITAAAGKNCGGALRGPPARVVTWSGASSWRSRLSEPVLPVEALPSVQRPPRPPIVAASGEHPQRGAFERFIESRFERAFGARLDSHYPLIAGLQRQDGAVVAAAGVRFAEAEPLFLESYLDHPVEQVLAKAFGRPLAREEVIEIGSLAADGPAAALDLFRGLAGWLAAGRRGRIAVATVRPELARLLSRSGFDLRVVAPADPGRLGQAAAQWGTYYDRGPQIFAGEVAPSPVIAQLRRRLQARGMDRMVRRLRRATS